MAATVFRTSVRAAVQAGVNPANMQATRNIGTLTPSSKETKADLGKLVVYVPQNSIHEDTKGNKTVSHDSVFSRLLGAGISASRTNPANWGWHSAPEEPYVQVQVNSTHVSGSGRNLSITNGANVTLN